MKANQLIIDGVDYIGTFYHGVKEDPDKEMYVQHGVWSEVKEFGYTKIACDVWLGYETEWVDYDKVKAVKIKDYRQDTDDYQEYIYK